MAILFLSGNPKLILVTLKRGDSCSMKKINSLGLYLFLPLDGAVTSKEETQDPCPPFQGKLDGSVVLQDYSHLDKKYALR